MLEKKWNTIKTWIKCEILVCIICIMVNYKIYKAFYTAQIFSWKKDFKLGKILK